MLERNAPTRFQGRIATVIAIVRENQPWLEEVIKVRDKLNHFQEGGVPYEFFKVRKLLRDDQEVVVAPMWNEATSVRDALGDVWRKLMCFSESFIGFTLYLRLKPYWGVVYTRIEDEGETESDEEAEDARWKFELDRDALSSEVMSYDQRVGKKLKAT